MQSYLFIGGNGDSINIYLPDAPKSIQLPAGVTDKESYVREGLIFRSHRQTYGRHTLLLKIEVAIPARKRP